MAEKGLQMGIWMNPSLSRPVLQLEHIVQSQQTFCGVQAQPQKLVNIFPRRNMCFHLA
jgi:hypothetical protein